MQNLDIFATANSTVATVRDSANAQTVAAPMFVIGISTTITLTLFNSPDDLLPLPVRACRHYGVVVRLRRRFQLRHRL